MSLHADTPRFARLIAFWLIAGVGASVLALAWFGFRATREWRRSSLMLVQSRAEETADVLVRTLARDMRAVDDGILRGVHWDELPLDSPHEISDRIASAFARYPYPEAFFGWDGVRHDENFVFFTRTDRRPHWLTTAPAAGVFPVSIVRDPPAMAHLTRRFAALAAQGRRFAAFETTVEGRSYQVVGRLLYRDPRRTQLERVFGFTVDLDWVRQLYFPELTAELSRLTPGSAGLRIAILDDRGRAVAGTPAVANGGSPIVARPLRPLFFDHELVLLNPATDLPTQPWTVQVDTGSDPAVAVAVRGADWTLGIATGAAVVLTLGLLLAGRALRASGELTRLRADFVSSVTHELKTPLATIRSAAETLARGRVTDAGGVSDYARLLDQEAQRLGRLVDNLLAYSRITDVSEVYTFEPLAVAELIDDLLRRFQLQFLYQRVEVTVDVPPDIADARADRTALLLVFDNLIDNALRYSPDRRELSLRAWEDERDVHIAVRDRGIGIPEDEIERVQLRFVRGRLARSNGSGLGLAIASRIIRDHGGEIAITSVVGEGTTVRVTLPRESRT
jgi:signal transduction histidine kinase